MKQTMYRDIIFWGMQRMVKETLKSNNLVIVAMLNNLVFREDTQNQKPYTK